MIFDNFNPKLTLDQVQVRLRSSDYTYATHYVSTNYHTAKNEYSTKIDLGDPDHILPYSGEYVLEIFVGDEMLEKTLTWYNSPLDPPN